MGSNTNKIKLSPRLRWGVGRNNSNISFFKISGIIFLIISIVLIGRAGTLLVMGGPEEPGSVLGAVDTKASTSNEAFTDYKVKKGDTLFTISKEYGIEWTALATINNLKPPFSLSVNQTLKIPNK